jgi:hypothetical protein
MAKWTGHTGDLTLRRHESWEIMLVGGDWNMAFIFPYIGKNDPN